MPDREKVINELGKHIKSALAVDSDYVDCVRTDLLQTVVGLLKEQEELLRKPQKDKDKLCLEVSEWKHKFHDAPPKFVSQGVVDQICWERDTALSQLEQIGKGLGSKMDDVVALLKEKEAVEPLAKEDDSYECICGAIIGWDELDASGIVQARFDYCPFCGKPITWEGR